MMERLRTSASEWGTDFFGVADLTSVREAIALQGGKTVASFSRAVSLGIALFHPIVDELPRRHEKAVAISYRNHGYQLISQRLDWVASRVSSLLQKEGYRVMPVPASKQVDDDRLAASFSHKMAAHLAGLGWIGKSCLLVTPEAGPRVRWSTVLTDAPLVPTGSLMAPRCGSCRACVDICPVGAFTDRLFDPVEPREARYNAHQCEAYFDRMLEQDENAVCGMCVYVCPYGRKASAALQG